MNGDGLMSLLFLFLWEPGFGLPNIRSWHIEFGHHRIGIAKE